MIQISCNMVSGKQSVSEKNILLKLQTNYDKVFVMQRDQLSPLRYKNPEAGFLCLFSFHYESWINNWGWGNSSQSVQTNIIRIITGVEVETYLEIYLRI